MKMNKKDFVFFFGTNGKKIEKACFSQFFMRRFYVDGHEYCCMELFMMAQKALLFKDMDILREILNCYEPKEIKALGRKVSNFRTKVWNEHKLDIVYKGNLAKFSQNEDLKEILLATGDKIIVEASPYDSIWGIGMSASNPNATDPEKWKGQNLLGKTLEKVRDTIRNS